MTNLNNHSEMQAITLTENTECNYKSSYTDVKLKDQNANQAALLSTQIYSLLAAAFTSTTKTQVDLLVELAKENNFTEQRLKDAVKQLVSTNQYPTWTIASVLGYDKKLYDAPHDWSKKNEYYKLENIYDKKIYWLKRTDGPIPGGYIEIEQKKSQYEIDMQNKKQSMSRKEYDEWEKSHQIIHQLVEDFKSGAIIQKYQDYVNDQPNRQKKFSRENINRFKALQAQCTQKNNDAF